MAWVEPFFWDGRADTLEAQAAEPITNVAEMNAKFTDVVKTLSNISEYNQWFDHLFPNKGVSQETILTALATYERTVVSGWTPFDRWVEGDETAISEAAKRGFELFNGKAKCADCHSGWNFTDNQFHDIGIETNDIGRAEFEPNNPKAKHAFKTPGLRNTAYRAPFMHNGSINTLEAVMTHYVTGVIQRGSLSPKISNQQISSKEQADIIEFMRVLTADKQETPVPILPN